ncbi:MAG: CoA transferase, partial [Alphaproteobacteria bacterium]
MSRPLDGIVVLDLTTGPAGALATMFLSDLGARTLRAVGPDAPLFRDGGFVIWDRGKEAIALDLGDPAAKGEIERLVPGVDVIVEDFAPSSPLQALVDRDRLAALNPRLVTCSITAYGKRGPLKDEPPIDDLVLARTGVMGGMPGFRPAPVHVIHPLPSVGAALFACIGEPARPRGDGPWPLGRDVADGGRPPLPSEGRRRGHRAPRLPDAPFRQRALLQRLRMPGRRVHPARLRARRLHRLLREPDGHRRHAEGAALPAGPRRPAG